MRRREIGVGERVRAERVGVGLVRETRATPVMTTMPLVPLVLAVIDRVSPSGSVSPARTSSGGGSASSATPKSSSSATGGSLTGSTVTLTVAVSVPPCPSVIVYVNESEPS